MRVIERHFDYVIDAGAIANGETKRDIQIQLQLDAPFCLRGLGGYVINEAGTAVTGLGGGFLQFDDSELRWLQSDLTAMTADIVVSGRNAQYSPYWRQSVYPKGSVVSFQLRNASGGDWFKTRLVFRGAKLFYEGQVWSPTYPSCYETLPFELSLTPAVTALQTLPDNLITIQGDADVVIRGAVATPVSGSIANLEFRLKDWRDNYYSNDFINYRWLFSQNLAQRPGIFYPEIYVPRNAQFLYDMRQGQNAAGSLNLSLIGAKVFPR